MPTKIIGTAPYQVPRNSDLGSLASQDADNVSITGGAISTSASTTAGYFQNTDVSETRPTVLLDFANSKTLDPRITFTRASNASYYDGTSTKAEENLIRYSQSFSNALWTKSVTAIDSSAIAPDGTLTACTISSTNTQFNGVWQAVPNVAGAYNVGYVYTQSIYAKAGTKSILQIDSAWSAVAFRANFDLTNGVIGTVDSGVTASMTSVGNGWYRCMVTYVGTNSANPNTIYSMQDSTSSVREGLSTAGTMYIWGAQLEQRSALTAYVPTTYYPITNFIPVLNISGANGARFDHDPVTGESKGLLIEESRTNLITYSQDFSNALWTKTATTVLQNATVAPDGSLNASKIVATSTASTMLSLTINPSAGWHTVTVYAKAAEIEWLTLRVDNVASDTAWFNLKTGTIGRADGAAVNPSITSVGNGWYRLAVTVNIPDAGAYRGIQLTPYAGDNTSLSSADVGKGYYLWGAQQEAGYYPTSYIPTRGASATRAADEAKIAGQNFDAIFNRLEGTLSVECSQPYFMPESRGSLSIHKDSDTTPRITIYRQGATGYLNTWLSTGVGELGAAALGGNYPVNTPNTICKQTTSYSFLSHAQGANGTLTYNNAWPMASVLQYVNKMSFGQSADGGYQTWNGHIRKVAIYGKKLSDAEVQEMTL